MGNRILKRSVAVLLSLAMLPAYAPGLAYLGLDNGVGTTAYAEVSTRVTLSLKFAESEEIMYKQYDETHGSTTSSENLKLVIDYSKLSATGSTDESAVEDLYVDVDGVIAPVETQYIVSKTPDLSRDSKGKIQDTEFGLVVLNKKGAKSKVIFDVSEAVELYTVEYEYLNKSIYQTKIGKIASNIYEGKDTTFVDEATQETLTLVEDSFDEKTGDSKYQYDLLGWSTDKKEDYLGTSEDVDYKTAAAYTEDADITLYPVLSKREYYDVTYKIGTDTIVHQDRKYKGEDIAIYEPEEKPTKEPTFNTQQIEAGSTERTAYEFAGWITTENTTLHETGEMYTEDKDVTFIPSFTPVKEYLVKFHMKRPEKVENTDTGKMTDKYDFGIREAENMVNVSEVWVKRGDYVTAPTEYYEQTGNSYASFGCEKYEWTQDSFLGEETKQYFNGWWLNNTDRFNIQTTAITESLILTAHWADADSRSYILAYHFNAEAGDGNNELVSSTVEANYKNNGDYAYLDSKAYENDDVVGGDAPELTLSDYKFAGWYTDKDCTDGNEFNINKSVATNLEGKDYTLNADGAVNLYAKWVAKYNSPDDVIIKTKSLDNGTAYSPYSDTVAARTNDANSKSVTRNFYLVDEDGNIDETAALPEGLYLNKTSGEIYGVPTKAGVVTIYVRVANDAGKWISEARRLTLTIDRAELNCYLGDSAKGFYKTYGAKDDDAFTRGNELLYGIDAIRLRDSGYDKAGDTVSNADSSITLKYLYDIEPKTTDYDSTHLVPTTLSVKFGVKMCRVAGENAGYYKRYAEISGVDEETFEITGALVDDKTEKLSVEEKSERKYDDRYYLKINKGDFVKYNIRNGIGEVLDTTYGDATTDPCQELVWMTNRYGELGIEDTVTINIKNSELLEEAGLLSGAGKIKATESAEQLNSEGYPYSQIATLTSVNQDGEDSTLSYLEPEFNISIGKKKLELKSNDLNLHIGGSVSAAMVRSMASLDGVLEGDDVDYSAYYKIEGERYDTEAEAAVALTELAENAGEYSVEIVVASTSENLPPETTAIYGIAQPGMSIGALTGADADNYKIESVVASTMKVEDHDFENIELKPATTAESGYTAYSKCTECGQETGKTVIAQIDEASISLADMTYVYDGKAKTPEVTVRDTAENPYTLQLGTDYTVTYSDNIGCGTAKATIKFVGNYRGSKVLYFTVKPKGTVNKAPAAASKAFTAKWSKQSAKMQKSRITGYQLQYSTSSKFSSCKTATVKGYSASSKKISNLKSKTKYYTRVRTYMKVGTKIYYSDWSATKSVKTK